MMQYDVGEYSVELVVFDSLFDTLLYHGTNGFTVELKLVFQTHGYFVYCHGGSPVTISDE